MALQARTICNVGFIERPIVLGFAWWLATGELAPALPLAIFFELFWLDLYPIGSFIPPMAGFPYLLLLALSGHLGWTTPNTIAFPLAVALPLAYAVPLLEYRQRDLQKNASNRLILHAQEIVPITAFSGKLLITSTLQQLGGGLLVFLTLYGGVIWVFSFQIMRKNAGLIPLDVDWSVLYAIAATGALLSLRIKRAYVVFAICMAAILFFRVI